MKPVTRRDFVRDSVIAGTAAAAGTTAAASSQTESGTNQRHIKIVGISCSPRKGKTTAAGLQICLQAAQDVSSRIQTELIELAGRRIDGSAAAGVTPEPGQADDFPALIPKLRDPSVAGIIIGTPVYFASSSSLCKAFLERCIAFWQDNFALSNKVAGVLAVGGTRNGGQELAIQSILPALLCQEMIVVGNGRPQPRTGATLWNSGADGITKDEIGIATAKSLGRRVAEVALKLNGITS